VCRYTSRYAVDIGVSLSVVRALSRVVRATAPAGVITPARAALALASCHSKRYELASALLAEDALSVSPSRDGVLVEDVLCYFFYGGIACGALKQWKQAVEAFAMTLVVPASALSAVTIEAEKRRVLCSLIAFGKVVDPPRSASQGTLRGIQRATEPYQKLAAGFVTMNPENLAQAITAQGDVFEKDGLQGLVKQVQQAQTQHRIRALTGTFLTVTLEEIAARIGLESADAAKEQVFTLVRKGLMEARIDEESGVVSFPEEADDVRDPAVVLGRLQAVVDSAMELSAIVESKEREVVTSSDFLAAAAKELLHSRGHRGDLSDIPY
jgi:COP9 signalosome complex subunit 3